MNKKGFSLVELLVVTGILGVLAAIASPAYGLTCDQVKAELDKASDKAKAKKFAYHKVIGAYNRAARNAYKIVRTEWVKRKDAYFDSLQTLEDKKKADADYTQALSAFYKAENDYREAVFKMDQARFDAKKIKLFENNLNRTTLSMEKARINSSNLINLQTARNTYDKKRDVQLKHLKGAYGNLGLHYDPTRDAFHSGSGMYGSPVHFTEKEIREGIIRAYQINDDIKKARADYDNALNDLIKARVKAEFCNLSVKPL